MVVGGVVWRRRNRTEKGLRISIVTKNDVSRGVSIHRQLEATLQYSENSDFEVLT